MHFLVDAQLPPALARWIANKGHAAEHVADLGLAAASDHEIWQQAIRKTAVIITKDADFANLPVFKADSPPVVWIRLRNTRRHKLLTWFATLFPKVMAALEQGEKLIEIG